MFDVLIVGGGAAGFFTAVNLKEEAPQLRVAILERSKQVLSKVKVSGGGRCNVTHAVFEPKELATYYPRGSKELLGPFHRFMTGDTMGWFETRGVPLKIEEDGRIFPISDSSQSIIDCLTHAAEEAGIEVLLQQTVKAIEKHDQGFLVTTSKETFECVQLVLTPGSSPQVWKMLEEEGHTIVAPVPSLFTFNIKHALLEGLAGLSTPGLVRVVDGAGKTVLEDGGPILITHWGLSGPAVLKLSAWGARELHDLDYRFKIHVNWLDMDRQAVLDRLKEQRHAQPKKQLSNSRVFELPKRLWTRIIQQVVDQDDLTWADASNSSLEQLADILTRCELPVEGKSTFKEEFVTAGGVALEEIDFRRFESKLLPGLYFAGEVLDIDAVTGGFNFQNAWTGGWIIAQTIASRVQA